MTPVEELRQAAAILRERAHKAAPAPWRFEGMQVRDSKGHLVIKHTWPQEADWILTVSPDVAEPLAAWLDYEANRLLSFPDGYSVKHSDDYPPFVLAHQINQAVQRSLDTLS